MNASIEGALENLTRFALCVTHRGMPLTKTQVEKILKYGESKGYEDTGQISEQEIDIVLKRMEDERKSLLKIKY